jgi:hypothetical protein
MITATDQGSATIIPFPVGGRKGLNQVKTSAEEASPRVPTVVGTAWYHDAAIQDGSCLNLKVIDPVGLASDHTYSLNQVTGMGHA